MEFHVIVDVTGPVFIPGYPETVMMRYGEHLEDVLGAMGVTMIKAYLPTQYMYLGHNGGDPRYNPVPANAGTYQSGIHTDRANPDQLLIHDTPVVYGPWLEGVGSRNPIIWPGRLARGLPGRFPGYHAFRKISQVLDTMAEDIAEAELGRYVEELNV